MPAPRSSQCVAWDQTQTNRQSKRESSVGPLGYGSFHQSNADASISVSPNPTLLEQSTSRRADLIIRVSPGEYYASKVNDGDQ